MASKWLPLGGAALLVLLVSAAGSPADARRGGGHGGHGGHSFSGARSFSATGSFSGARNFGSSRSYSRSIRGPVNFGNRLQLRSNGVRPYADFGQRRRFHQGHVLKHGHHRRHRRAIVGVPIIFGGYYYYYGDCDWLRRRAFATGSPYWWDRYYACVYEGGY